MSFFMILQTFIFVNLQIHHYPYIERWFAYLNFRMQYYFIFGIIMKCKLYFANYICKHSNI